MKTASSRSSIFMGAALGFVAMAAVGWEQKARHAPASSKVELASNSAPSRPARPIRHTGPPEDVTQRMSAIRNAATPAERMRATIALADSISLAEIGAWLDAGWFSVHGGGPEVMIFTQIAKARWQAGAPAEFSRWSMKSDPENAGSGLAEWAKGDRSAALAYLAGQPGNSTTMRALADLAKQDPALAAEAYRKLLAQGLSPDGISYSSSFMTELAKKDPASLEAMLDSLPANVRKQADMALSGARLLTSFSTEIRSLWDRPDGWAIFRDNSYRDRKIGENLFAELPNLPPSWRHSLAESSFGMLGSDSAKWFHADLEGFGFDAADAGRIRSSVIISLTHSDPDQAVAMLNSGSIPRDQISNAISNFINNLSGDPAKAESLIAQLATEEDRQTARTTLDRNVDQQQARKAATPEEWVAQISAVDPKSSSMYSYTSALEQWKPEAIAQLATQFQTMPDDTKKKVATALTNGYSPGIDANFRGDAVSYLVAHPDTPVPRPGSYQQPDPSISLASSYAVQLSTDNPESAGSWVQSLQAGEAQNWAQKNLAATWTQYDPEAAARWVASLPPSNRSAVQDYLKNPRR